MSSTYLTRFNALQQELAEIRADLVLEPENPMLRAREQSVVRSMRWYSARLEERPQKPKAPTSQQKVARVHAAGGHLLGVQP